MKLNRILTTGLILVGLAGCTDPIYMKNQDTGQVVECGPYWTGMASDFKLDGIAKMQAQCINDYKEQGFVRNPGPK